MRRLHAIPIGWTICLSLLIAAAGVGCATRPATSGSAWVRTELYFGLTKPGGGLVTESDWKTFLDTDVTPRFPDGLTVVQAQGRYRSRDQSLHEEPTGILIILHPANAEDDGKIDGMCREYIRKFDQESVLRSDSTATATFITGQNREPAVGPHRLSR